MVYNFVPYDCEAWSDHRLLVGTALREIHTAVVHVAAVSAAIAEQLVGPDTPYPALHVNWHEAPSARLLAHVPSVPLVGAVTAHGAYVGVSVGEGVGEGVGEDVGAGVGEGVGEGEGEGVGEGVGEDVGIGVGVDVGAGLGEDVGARVGVVVTAAPRQISRQ